MNRYTLYCTPEQAKKALELGAPINARNYYEANEYEDKFDDNTCLYIEEGKYYPIPTAEQIIGWMEKHSPIDNIDIYKQITTWHYCVYLSTLERISGKGNSRQEATLAAIDVALDYLISKKQ